MAGPDLDRLIKLLKHLVFSLKPPITKKSSSGDNAHYVKQTRDIPTLLPLLGLHLYSPLGSPGKPFMTAPITTMTGPPFVDQHIPSRPCWLAEWLQHCCTSNVCLPICRLHPFTRHYPAAADCMAHTQTRNMYVCILQFSASMGMKVSVRLRFPALPSSVVT